VSSLADLLAGLGAQVTGDPATPVSSICYDSRAVRAGALFVALRGGRSDGHRHLRAALDAGAHSLLVEDVQGVPSGARAVARVADTRRALADVAARFHGRPGDALRLIGVTGTNGKTSTVRMIESILTHAGVSAGSLGTVSVRYAGREEPAQLTTPDAPELQATLRRMLNEGVTHVAMEVSSHSLASERVRGLRFGVAVFTNLTQDHLDFHGDLTAYGNAKARLFGSEYLSGGTAIVNARDPLAAQLAREARTAGARVLRYDRGKDSDAEIRTLAEDVGLAGSRLAVETPAGSGELDLPLPGDFQIENALAALGAGCALGLEWDVLRAGLEKCPPVPGRLERVSAAEPAVFVDYAHTPDALDRVLGRVRALCRGRLICVFGCGGDRDRSKRVPMARAACRHADHVIATSDNPRTEDAGAILREIAQGLAGSSEVIEDRRAAIARAIELAAPHDVVVIAGKGHEDYQIIGTERRHFDDREEARAALAARAAREQST